jgi:acyl-coenzyme A thioesterase PaaI-like protein
LRKGRRVDIAEMTVTNQEGKLIAKATGTAIPMA